MSSEAEDYGDLIGMADIRSQEEELLRKSRSHIQGLQAQKAICEGMLMLQSDQRFQAFIKEIARLRGTRRFSKWSISGSSRYAITKAAASGVSAPFST